MPIKMDQTVTIDILNRMGKISDQRIVPALIVGDWGILQDLNNEKAYAITAINCRMSMVVGLNQKKAKEYLAAVSQIPMPYTNACDIPKELVRQLITIDKQIRNIYQR